MNGIGLLVLIAVAGQVGFPQQQQLSRDYGWEIDTKSGDGALCFIVQVSPEDALRMQTQGLENPADIPEELIGRAKRVAFRIGTAELPQNPSLEVLRTMPRLYAPSDVTAQFDQIQGRMADVERESVVNVQQDRSAPALPNFGGTASPAPVLDPANIIDKAKQGTGSLIDNLPNLARGTPSAPFGSSNALADTYAPRSAPPPNTGSQAPALPSFSGTPSSRFNDQANTQNPATANTAAQNPMGSNLSLPSTTGGDWRASLENNRTRDETTRTADRSSNNYGQGGYNNYAQSNAPGFLPNPPSMDRELFGLPTSQTPTPGFGSYPGSNNPGNNGQYAGNSGQGGVNASTAGQLGRGYGTGGYGGGYSGGSNFQPGSGYRQTVAPQNVGADPGYRTASNLDPTLSQLPPNSNAKSPADLNTDNDSQAQKAAVFSKTTQGFLQVFLLLSLVVNCYLGYLISKLLTRYRSVLTNLRAQTA